MAAKLARIGGDRDCKYHCLWAHQTPCANPLYPIFYCVREIFLTYIFYIYVLYFILLSLFSANNTILSTILLYWSRTDLIVRCKYFKIFHSSCCIILCIAAQNKYPGTYHQSVFIWYFSCKPL